MNFTAVEVWHVPRDVIGIVKKSLSPVEHSWVKLCIQSIITIFLLILYRSHNHYFNPQLRSS